MKIHWFTFIAQVINFFILVYLLKRFLYGPIIAAMDEREKNIAKALDDAEAAKKTADDAEASFTARRKELDEKRQELMAQAEQEAAGRKKDLVHKARSEVSEQQARWRESLRQEKESFLKELRQRASEQLWRLARRMLADLASADLELQIVDVFVDKLEAIGEDERKRLVAAVGDDGTELTVASSFALPDDAHRRVAEAVEKGLGPEFSCNFVVSPEVVAGIELKAGGHKVTWSVGDYLQELEEQLLDAVEDEVARVVPDDVERKPAEGDGGTTGVEGAEA